MLEQYDMNGHDFTPQKHQYFNRSEKITGLVLNQRFKIFIKITIQYFFGIILFL